MCHMCTVGLEKEAKGQRGKDGGGGDRKKEKQERYKKG